jgi:hypothetical protein
MDSLGTPPETSNFYCLPGRAGGTLVVLAFSGSRTWVVGIAREPEEVLSQIFAWDSRGV